MPLDWGSTPARLDLRPTINRGLPAERAETFLNLTIKLILAGRRLLPIQASLALQKERLHRRNE